MTGLPPSRVRFYEKAGLFKAEREENGYRVYSRDNAFRANAFRMLLQYGFTIEEAVDMIDRRQDTPSFAASLDAQYEKLRHERDLLDYRLQRIERARRLLEGGVDGGITVNFVDDQCFIAASRGLDFSVSLENEAEIARFYDLLSITYCARIIEAADFAHDSETVDPSYIIAMPAHERWRLGEGDSKRIRLLRMGTCVRQVRYETRKTSVRKSTYDKAFEFIDAHGYSICGDFLLLPSFLNLDGAGSDVEILYIPVKKDR